MDEGEIAGRQLVVPGRNSPVLFKPPDKALDHVPLPVQRPIHEPWPLLGLELWDNGADPLPPQERPSRAAGIAAITDKGPRPQLGAARAFSFHATLAHQLRQGGPLVPLSGRQHEGEWSAAPITAEVELAAVTAP